MALHVKWSSGDQIWYDGTQTVFTIQDDDEGIIFGEDSAGVDVRFYGNTASAYLDFDESADLLNFENIKVTNQAPNTVAATGAIVTTTLTTGSNRFQFIDTTGDASVALPTASGETAIGIQYFIGNTSTATLTVYNGATGVGDVVAEIAVYESGILINDGNEWKGIVNTAT